MLPSYVNMKQTLQRIFTKSCGLCEGAIGNVQVVSQSSSVLPI